MLKPSQYRIEIDVHTTPTGSVRSSFRVKAADTGHPNSEWADTGEYSVIANAARGATEEALRYIDQACEPIFRSARDPVSEHLPMVDELGNRLAVEMNGAAEILEDVPNAQAVFLDCGPLGWTAVPINRVSDALRYTRDAVADGGEDDSNLISWRWHATGHMYITWDPEFNR